jgi:uncharacterized OsmC-like protein
MTMTTQTQTRVNGIDIEGVGRIVEQVKNDRNSGFVQFKVATTWKGGTRSEARVKSYVMDGVEIPRQFAIASDEPIELLGENTAPNPQELLMAALNACIMVGYVANAALMGVTLKNVEIETVGELNLRGFLGIDESVKPGYDSLRYTVRLTGDGSREQYQTIHENVVKTSPNYLNIANPVRIDATLEC